MRGRARPHWAVALGSVCLVTLAVFGSLVSTSGLIEFIRKDLGFSYAKGGFLLSVPFPVIAFFAVTGGVLVDRLGVGRMVTLGAALAILGGGARVWAEGFWLLAGGTVFVGAGVGFIFPALPKLVSASAPPDKREFAASLYTAGVVSGAGLGVAVSHLMAPLARLAPLAPGGEGWRGGYLGWALVLLAAFLAWRWVSSGEPAAGREEEGESPAPSGRAGVLRHLAVWAVAGSLFVENAIFYASIGWLPSVLAEKGWTPAQAAAIASLVPWLGLLAVLTGHRIAPWLGGERRMVLSSILATAALLALVPVAGAWPVAAATAVIGLTLNFWFVFCLGFPARSIPAEQAGRAAGVIIGLGYLGGFLGPWAAGALRDAAGGFAPAFYAMAAFAALAALSAPYFGRAAPAGY